MPPQTNWLRAYLNHQAVHTMGSTADVITVYELPYDRDYPVVCMDESCKQLIGEVREAIACAPGRPARVDDEYVRNGVAEIFLEVEPLTGKRHVAATERRTRKDWAWWIKGMLDERYPNAVPSTPGPG